MGPDLGLVLLCRSSTNCLICKAMEHSNFSTFYTQTAKCQWIEHYSNLYKRKRHFIVTAIGITGAGRIDACRLWTQRSFQFIGINTSPPMTSRKTHHCVYPHYMYYNKVFSTGGNKLQNDDPRKGAWFSRVLQARIKAELCLWNMTWQTYNARCVQWMTYRVSIAL